MNLNSKVLQEGMKEVQLVNSKDQLSGLDLYEDISADVSIGK